MDVATLIPSSKYGKKIDNDDTFFPKHYSISLIYLYIASKTTTSHRKCKTLKKSSNPSLQTEVVVVRFNSGGHIPPPATVIQKISNTSAILTSCKKCLFIDQNT